MAASSLAMRGARHLATRRRVARRGTSLPATTTASSSVTVPQAFVVRAARQRAPRTGVPCVCGVGRGLATPTVRGPPLGAVPCTTLRTVAHAPVPLARLKRVPGPRRPLRRLVQEEEAPLTRPQVGATKLGRGPPHALEGRGATRVARRTPSRLLVPTSPRQRTGRTTLGSRHVEPRVGETVRATTSMAFGTLAHPRAWPPE